MPLHVVDAAVFGGVDSRSNPVNVPQSRFLRLRNVAPVQDGHLELRDGYVQAFGTGVLSGYDPTFSIAVVPPACDFGNDAYYFVIVKETTSGPWEISNETEGDSCGGDQVITFLSIPNDGNAVAWRFYSGTDSANEDMYLRLTEAEVVTLGRNVPIRSRGVAGRVPQVVASLTSGPLHSIIGYISTDFDAEQVLFWQGTKPYVYNLNTGLISAPTIRGTAIASSERWMYALGGDGYLYMHNGTDKKFFDGQNLRDIGLPPIAIADATSVSVTAAESAPDPAAVNTCALTWTAAAGVSWPGGSGVVYMGYFDLDTNLLLPCITPMNGGVALGASGVNQSLHITGIPSSTNPRVVALLSALYGGFSHPLFWNEPQSLGSSFTMTASGTTVTVHKVSGNHGFSTDNVIALSETGPTPTWSSNGPYAITVTSLTDFTFEAATTADAAAMQAYGHAVQVQGIYAVPNGTAAVTLPRHMTFINGQGTQHNTSGAIMLPYSDSPSTALLPKTVVDSAQPGYQFFASIYNPTTGAIGNRMPIGSRLQLASASGVAISNLPDYSGVDSEWDILIGRTGDGGEVPYAVRDALGNWIFTSSGQTSINITSALVDFNAELPTENDQPPAFVCFWREGDRLCGVKLKSAFVYRSAAPFDSETGTFVGNPAQAWPPRRVMTFPTAEHVIGGHGYQFQSLVWTRNDVAVLTELQGATQWDGPWNIGIAGQFAYAEGWRSLPYWVSHDLQLCTIEPGSNSPIPISGEYERSLLRRIDRAYLADTEIVYFRDPERLVDVLRIKARDANGIPFTIIHDFLLRDGETPFGAGYEVLFEGPLEVDFTESRIRDADGEARVWAGGSNGQMFQLYTGANDREEEFTADAVQLYYISPNHVAIKMIEWYGDENLEVYVSPDLNTGTGLTQPIDNPPVTMQRLDPLKYRVPGQENDFHWEVDLDNPEMVHAWIWLRMHSHSADAPVQDRVLNEPPHMPLETYGKLLMAAAVVGTARGR